MMDAERNNPSPRPADGVQRWYALVVGVSNYEDPALRLPFCVADAIKLGGILEEGGYEVTQLVNPPAADVKVALQNLIASADADDVVLFYFSGHGRLVDHRPYLLLADTPNSDDGIKQHGLPLASVLEMLRGDPRWVVVFLDACHMGLGLDPEASKSTSHGLERNGGFALLSGSTTGGITQDTDGAGIFSKKLHDGLTGAAADPDGGVRFSMLAQHVQRSLAAWRASPEGRAKMSTQTPVLRLEVADIVVLPPNDCIEIDTLEDQKINAAAFSPSGHRLATVSGEMVELWDPATGLDENIVWMLDSDSSDGDSFQSVAFAPNGNALAAVSKAGHLQIRDASAGSEVAGTWLQMPASPRQAGASPRQEGQVHLVATALAWSPNSLRLAVASSAGVYVYDIDALGNIGEGHPRVLTDHEGVVKAVAFAPDGQLITGGADGTVRTWNVDTGECICVFHHEGSISAVAVSPDGRFILAGGSDDKPTPQLVNVPRIWDRTTRKVVRPLVDHTRAVTAVSYAPAVAGDLIATASQDGRARIWRASDGQMLRAMTGEVLWAEDTLDEATPDEAATPEACTAVFSPDGKQLFVGFADGSGRFFYLSPRAR